MALRKLMEQLEEQPLEKKPRIDNAEEQGEIATSDEEDSWPKLTSMKRKDEVPDENSPMDLLHSRPLPLELNCEIFKCLKLPIQCQFIWGLGRGIYEMFGQKLIIKSKRLRNPAWNRWFGRNRANYVISEDGLNISAPHPHLTYGASNTLRAHNVLAEHGFPITGEYSRRDSFPGTILYYYEVSVLSFQNRVKIGLSPGTIPARTPIGLFRNSYAIKDGCRIGCYLNGEAHRFVLPEGAIRPEKKKYANVYGCGLVLDPGNKLSIFFTLNGKLLGKQIPISPSPSVVLLFPSIRMWEFYSEANFGDDPSKPFEYDIRNCPGLGLPCI